MNTTTHTYSSCPVCTGENLSTRPYNSQLWPNIAEFKKLLVLSCGTCGFGFINQDLSDEFLASFYATQYRAKGSAHHIDFSAITKAASPRAIGQLTLAKKYASVKPGDYFLDIGPGAGHSFDAANSLFGNLNNVAIELTNGAEKVYADLYRATTYGTLQEFTDTGNRASIALFSHCLEHFNPSKLDTTLDEIKSALRADSILVVEVPHVDPKQKNRFQDSPHCVFFSADSLRKLFEKNGWDVLFTDTVGQTYSEYFGSRGLRFGTAKKNLMTATLNRVDALQVRFRKILRRTLGIVENDNLTYGGTRVYLRLVAKPIFNTI